GAAAPLMTALAGQIGYNIPQDAVEVTSLAVGTPWNTWIVYYGLHWFGGIL
ncbi:PTS galactitol transporter subunit IIC, partial [Listeria monocytogenes]|nr:PTS galactitol transporter subunit IIC [Listeria monocytogenes]